jgi:multidrug efflux system membrane fusion protein
MAGDTLTLNIMVRGDNTTRYSGELDFIDNEVNTTTGTFSLRGAVSNQSGELWPGQFAKVELKLGTQKNAVVAPYEAVQLGKKGYYLFAVTGKGTAELRNVKTGQRYGDHIVIHSGVKSGETVVTSGQMGLAPGVPVIDTKKGTGK